MDNEEYFFNKLAKEIHSICKSKGFYDDVKDIPTLLMLIVSECSEALEADRSYRYYDFNEEVADIIIRTLDMCAYLHIDIDKYVRDKILKNKSREYRHGKKY